MGRVLVHWLLVVGVGMGLSVLGAYWIAEYGADGRISRAILAAYAFSLARWQVWLALAMLLLWQNRRRIGPWLPRGPGRTEKFSGT